MAAKDLKQFSVRVPEELYKSFKIWCVQNDATIQEAIRRFMEMMTKPREQ